MYSGLLYFLAATQPSNIQSIYFTVVTRMEQPFRQYRVNLRRESDRERELITQFGCDWWSIAIMLKMRILCKERTMELICRQRQKHFEACLPNCMKWDGKFIRTANLWFSIHRITATTTTKIAKIQVKGNMINRN